MNIKELKEKIKDLPDHVQVFLDERITDFRYGLLESANLKEIKFSETPDGEDLAEDEVLILSEDI